MLLFKFACCSPTAFHSSKQHKQEYFGCHTADEHFWHEPGEPCRAALQICIWNETTGEEDQVSIRQQRSALPFSEYFFMAVGGMWKNHSTLLSAKNYMKIPDYNRILPEW